MERWVRPKILLRVMAAGWMAASAYVGILVSVPGEFWDSIEETIARHDQEAFVAAAPIDWNAVNEDRFGLMADDRLLVGELDIDNGAKRGAPRLFIDAPAPERPLPEHWTPPPLRTPDGYDLG